MENFITTHIASIITVLVLLIVVVVLFVVAKGKYRKTAKQILLSLVIAAEKKYGSGTGEIKFSYVAQQLYEKMPAIVQILFTADDVALMIEEAVTYMKKYLKNDTNVLAATEEE